jgi:hypothetical protein
LKCWVCEENAHAACRFCGRFICTTHTSKLPFFMAVYIGANQVPKVIVVADAIWCGICRPQPEPIEMPEIY